MVGRRSFAKAEYSPLHMGHFALASKKYCHFTSPIRRYADLLVHRALQSYLERDVDLSGNKEQLAEIGRHITFTEERAEDAEREVKTVLILHMLGKRVGSELDCVVTGITGFGLFAQSKKYGVEGLIQLSDLGPDRWEYNDKFQCVFGVNSGVGIHLGRPIKTKIVSVNIAARQLNLQPANPLVDPQKQSKTAPSKKNKRKNRTTKRRKGKRFKRR